MKRGLSTFDPWQLAALTTTLLAAVLVATLAWLPHSPTPSPTRSRGPDPNPSTAARSQRPDFRALDPRQTCAAFEQLADDGSSVDILVLALSPERSPGVRHCAAERLSEFDSEQAAEPLWRLAQAADADLSQVALSGLVRRRDRTTRQLFDSLEGSTSPQGVRALVAMAEAHVADVAPKIIQALARTRDPDTQRRLTEALGASGDALAIDPLMALTASPPLAQAAYMAIGRIGGPLARKFLTQQLWRSADAEVSAVAEGLARIGGPEVHQFLEQVMRSEREVLRLAAQSALFDIDSADVREFMLRELAGSAPETVISYFTEAVEPRAIPLLEKLLQDKRANLPALATSALINQGVEGRAAIARTLHAGPSGDLANALFENAASVLSLRKALRAAAVARLGAGATARGSWFDYLAGDLSDEAREALVAAAHDVGSSNSAISALSSRGDRAAIASLDLLSRDPDQRVANQARSALEQGAGLRSLPALLSELHSPEPETRRQAISLLLSINAEEGQRALDAACSSTDAQDRVRAPQLLLQFGPEHPQRRLEAMTNDLDVNVASASLGALLSVDRERAEQIVLQALRSGPRSFRFATLSSPEYPDILADFARTADPVQAAEFVASAQMFGYFAGNALEYLGGRSDLPEVTRLRARELSQGRFSNTKIRLRY